MKELLRFHTVFVEGINYHLDIEDAQIPGMADQMEDFRGGGMDGAIDVELGIEKAKASMMMLSLNPALLQRAGLASGKRTRVTFRGHTVSEFTDDEKDVLCIVEGRISANPKAWKSGSKTGVEYPISGISYYKLLIGGELMWERDIPNMIRRVGNIDQLLTARRSLGF